MTVQLDFLLPENRNLLDIREKQRREVLKNPDLLPPWLRPCKVRLLMVADGFLDFSNTDFGLATFVGVLLDTWFPTRFEITLAHLEERSGSSMMSFESRIKDRISRFEFDRPEHFTADKFDVVFLFGYAASLNRVDDNGNTRTDADGNPYPISRLADTELQALGEFQNAGGGLFATGDHGALGRFIGQAMPRARNMRLWDSTSANPALDEVSMGGRRRNDTNRLGDAGSQFNDQSDDIPQSIQPKMYSVRNWLFKYSFPHPVLCGPLGAIRVMPDHPHEGECIEPPDPNLQLNFTGALGDEYPAATDGGPRPLPEIISHNSVLSGTTSGVKAETEPHSFGGISAYDGHRASIGRVITDATWHHFVNVNLIGEFGNTDPIKSKGFLASASGQQHFQNIKAYYRNLAIWLSRKSNIHCMNTRWIVRLVHADRVLEAVMTTSDVKLDQISPATLWLIGRHARDVLGNFAGRCQSVRLILDLLFPVYESRLPDIDPWRNTFTEEELKDLGQNGTGRVDGDINWINASGVLDVALGAALVTVNERVRFEKEAPDDDAVMSHAIQGAKLGAEMAVKSLDQATTNLRDALLKQPI